MSHPTPLRLSLWYAAATGSLVCYPYLAVVLSDSGVSDRWIATALALLPLGNLIGGPVWAWVSDRLQAPRRTIGVSAVATVFGCLALLFAPGGRWLAGALLLYSFLRAPQFPLADALTVRTHPRGAQGYGSVRLWGSVAYLIAAVLAGWASDDYPRAALLLTLGFLVWLVFATRALPEAPPAPPPTTAVALRALVGNPVLWLLVLICLLHGVGVTSYDNLYSLHIRRLGHPQWVTGASIAMGVGAEIAVMALAGRLTALLGARGLVLLGVASGIPRWWLTGTLTDPMALVALQSLHGLSFGAFWVAMVGLFAEQAPPGLEGSTQALAPAATFGAGTMVSMLVASQVLHHGAPADFFRGLTLTSVLATLGVLVLYRQARPRPSGSGAPGTEEARPD